MADRAFLERMMRELTDQRKLIEAGWLSMRLACDLHDAPADQLREMRMAFFGGAQHLFSSIISILEPGAEPTDKDLERMASIHIELDDFIKDFERQHGLRKDKPMATMAAADKIERLGDAPIEQQYRAEMNSLAQYLDRFLNGPHPPQKTGFVLLVFPLGDHAGRCNYISNGAREDVVVLLREQLRRFEGAPEVSGRA